MMVNRPIRNKTRIGRVKPKSTVRAFPPGPSRKEWIKADPRLAVGLWLSGRGDLIQGSRFKGGNLWRAGGSVNVACKRPSSAARPAGKAQRHIARRPGRVRSTPFTRKRSGVDR